MENHAGAGATAAPALVAKSPANGYTVLINTSAQAYSAVLSKKLPYDPLKDFIPVASLTTQPYVLVAVAGFDFPIWYGIWAPAGTLIGVVDELSHDIARVLGGRDLQDWIAKHGGEPMSMTQPEFARFVQSESESATRLINTGGIKPRTRFHG